MEQEEEIVGKADGAHHSAVLGDDPVHVERTPSGKALVVLKAAEVPLGL